MSVAALHCNFFFPNKVLYILIFHQDILRTFRPWQIYQKVSADSRKLYQQPINKEKHDLAFQVLYNTDFKK